MTLRTPRTSAETPCDSELRDAIGALVPQLRARALRLCRSRADAEDLVQETIVRALRFESTYRRGTNVRAWAHQILQSVFVSRCRRTTRERRALARFVGDPTLTRDAVPPAPLGLVSDEMHSALAALPDSFRRAVELVDLEERSYREAADVLGVPVGTVMSRLFRARRLLQSSLERPPASGVRAVRQPALAAA